jgi:predicted nucleic acid-binding protein
MIYIDTNILVYITANQGTEKRDTKDEANIEIEIL